MNKEYFKLIEFNTVCLTKEYRIDSMIDFYRKLYINYLSNRHNRVHYHHN